MGFPTECIRWINSFLTDRQATLRFDGEAEPTSAILTGIQQRSPISSIIFLLYVKPLFDQLEKGYRQVKCPSYVDDVELMVVGTHERRKCRTLEKMARTACEWGKSRVVQFDDPKSELMHDHCLKTRDPSPGACVKLTNDTVIEACKNQRWLGQKAEFQTHIKTTTAAAMRAFMTIVQLANNEKQLSHKSPQQLYKAFASPPSATLGLRDG